MNPDDVAPMIVISVLALSAGAVLILRGPIGKAIARRLEGSSTPSAEAGARLGELEGRVAELERERHELAERVDFAERLLGQVRDGSGEARR